MILLFQYLSLLGVHYAADFICQTHWQASNKSKRWDALLAHVGVYTGLLAIATLLFFPDAAPLRMLAFVALNGLLHLATDYCTSRISSRHFGYAMQDTYPVMRFADCYGHPPDEVQMRRMGGKDQPMGVEPARHWHNFFVVIGGDQLIHQICLAVTLAFILVP